MPRVHRRGLGERAVRAALVLGALCLLAGGPALARDAQPFPKAKAARFHSAALGQARDLRVWLPPGYARDKGTRYPVIYVLHGLGGSERDFFKLGRLESHLQAALAAGALPPVIVVSPDGDDGYWTDHAPNGPTDRGLAGAPSSARTSSPGWTRGTARCPIAPTAPSSACPWAGMARSRWR
jgi:hypothetical protein